MNRLHLLAPLVPTAHSVLLYLDAALSPWLGGASVAVSLVLVTVLVRLMIMPLSVRDRAVRQASALTVVYRLSTVPLVTGSPNLVLSADLFGAPPAQQVLAIMAGSGVLPALVFAVAVALLSAVAAWSSSLAVARLDPATDPGTSEVEQVQARGACLVARIVPFGTVGAALVIPFAASLYLLTSTAWATLERVALARALG